MKHHPLVEKKLTRQERGKLESLVGATAFKKVTEVSLWPVVNSLWPDCEGPPQAGTPGGL